MGNHYINDTLVLMPDRQVKNVYRHKSVAQAATSVMQPERILLKMFGILLLASLLYIPIIQHEPFAKRYSEVALEHMHS